MPRYADEGADVDLHTTPHPGLRVGVVAAAPAGPFPLALGSCVGAGGRIPGVRDPWRTEGRRAATLDPHCRPSVNGN